jgi:outer membrane protein assembly factor BamD (BamD/ComL family)
MSKMLMALALSLAALPALGQGLRTESTDESAIFAYGSYWQNFDEYESHRFQARKDRHLEAWDRLKSRWNAKDKELTEAQLADLRNAAKRYEKQLKEHPSASSTPYARLNLAQVYNQLGTHQGSSKAGEPFKRQALAVLADLGQSLPDSSLNDEALYLRATILEGLDSSESALSVWKNLAKVGKDTIYTVHAHLAVGDSEFEKERAEEALKAYESAKAVLERVMSPEMAYEKIRVNYRLAWAAYRSADLERSVAAAQSLLRPELDFKKISLEKRMTQDACDLIGDALFEKDQLNRAKDFLQRDFLLPYASNIGLRLLSRLASRSAPKESLELGEFLLEHYPSSRESPEIATILADIYRTQNQESQYIATLERLSLMLPKSSVWRVQHKNDPELVASMENKAFSANQMLAAKFYEMGMTQGSQSSLETARSYYDALLKYDPQNGEAETWELRRAHVLYLAGHFEEADHAYDAFKTRVGLAPENLEVAYYQQALVREKMWRASLAKFDESQTKPGSADLIKLKNLQASISAYADRFPNKTHVVDLLLLAADANRDLGDSATAESFWNRALLSEPKPPQRTLAIRGLVQSKMHAGRPEETLGVARNYLKLENFEELGGAFQAELLSVVAKSAKETAASLNAKGKVQEAGQLLLAISNEFPGVPGRDNLYRDGAYYMALSGNWKDSEKAASHYLAEGTQGRNAEDLLYLKARSLEYQLRFRKAAEAHFALAKTYPKFEKSPLAAERSETLAAAEDDYKLAGQAAGLVALYKKDPESKTEAWLRSADYFAKAKAWTESLKVLARVESEGRSANTRLRAQLQMAKVWNSQGDAQKALSAYKRLAAEADRLKEDLDVDLYRKISAESNYLLADALGKSAEEDYQARLSFKGSRLEESLSLFNKAIAADDSEWSSRARFRAAELAETMSQSIRSQVAKGSKPDPILTEQARRWLQVSQQYHTQNLLARQKEPFKYKDVVWIERSALKASGLQPQVEPSSRNLPSALDTTQPYQWSH